MKEYILNLEKEFSLIDNGFKEEEKRALADYLSNDNVYTKELAFLAFKSNVYQEVRNVQCISFLIFVIV